MLGRCHHAHTLRVLISGPDGFPWFPVTGHRAAFRMAQREVQKPEAD